MKPIIYNLLNAYDNKKLKSWKNKTKRGRLLLSFRFAEHEN